MITREKQFSMSWKPAAVGLPAMSVRPRALGQGGAETLLDSSLLAIMTDFTAASASAYLAYNFGRVDNKWSTFFWVISAMSSVKLLHDLARQA